MTQSREAARIAVLEAELAAMNARGRDIAAQFLRARGQVVLLTRALEKYAFHAADCARRQMHVCADGGETIPSAVLADCECTCGLDRIVTADATPDAARVIAEI